MDSLWKLNEISKKWPAARLLGPKVTKEQALDFIFRTDTAIQCPLHCCNDRVFEKRLANLLGYPKEDESRAEYFKHMDELHKKLNLICLEYLSSNWVASSFISGPNGPVSPDGEVKLAKNFGKWPSIEEIENELTIIAEEFPWLKFKLGIKNDEMSHDYNPESFDFAWDLSEGKWSRISTINLFDTIPKTESVCESIKRFANRRRETTWTIDQIKDMWGDRIKQAQ